MKTAIIVGVKGQDGFFLCTLLKKMEYQVVGIDQQAITPQLDFGQQEPFDIRKPNHVTALVKAIRPDEIYYLAAFHQSSQDRYVEDFEILIKSLDINEVSLFNFLQAITQFSPATRLFYAASSHIFGTPPTETQNETTPINPTNLYGITKASGLFLCRKFRIEHNTFASCGILYNHESLRRAENFISKKIISGVVNALENNQQKLELGNLGAIVDWGYAPDYVDAMRRILLLSKPDDFVVATGIQHTVKDFVKIAYETAGLNWRDHVIEKPDIIKKNIQPLIGDSEKLKRLTGWTPSLTFNEMVKLMVIEEINNVYGKQ